MRRCILRFVSAQHEVNVPPVKQQETWAFLGTKGGVGASTLAAAIGFQLSRLGRRVLLVDGRFSAANVCTRIGIPRPPQTLRNFLESPEGTPLEGFAAETPYPNLSVVSAGDGLGDPRLPVSWLQRLRSAISALPVDNVVMDVGDGDTLASLDLANFSEHVTLVAHPDSASAERVAATLPRLALRRLATRAVSAELRQAAQRVLEAELEPFARSIPTLLSEMKNRVGGVDGQVESLLAEMDVALLVNAVRDDADRMFGAQLSAVVERHFGLRCRYAGPIRFDEAIARSQRRGGFCMVEANRSQGADDIRRATRSLLSQSDLSPIF